MKTKASFAGIMRLVNIVFLIVLENFALDNGMGYYGIAVLIYSLMYMILMGSMHASISKMVNARNNRGLVNSSAKLLRVGISYSFAAGVIVSIFSYLFAEKIMQSMFGNAYAGPTVHIFAFVFLINAMIDVITGYFIGKGNALLNNLSQLLKTFLPIIISLIVVRFMKNYGKNVAGLLNRRGFNIDSITVGASEVEGLARMVFVVKGDEKVLEQVIKQLHKLVDVVKIKDLDPEYVLKRELCLVKVKTTREKSRSEIIEYADIFKAKIIDVCDDFITMEVTGNPEKIDSFLRLLKPFGIKKIARTGPTAIARGHH